MITTYFILGLIVVCLILGCIDFSPTKVNKKPKNVDIRVRRQSGQIARKIPIKDHTGVVGYIYL